MAPIREAIAWGTGTDAQRSYTHVWPSGEYSIALGKPGKEASWVAPKKTNANDMLPTIFHNEVSIDYVPTFAAVWREIETLSSNAESQSAELLACLLFRTAYMLDHREVASGIWRYEPPPSVVAEIERRTPDVGTMTGARLPIAVFLHFIEALSLNEDVKYYTLGEAEAPGRGELRIKAGVGRRNNLTTCVNVIAVILKLQSVVDFGDAMVRGFGIAPLAVTKAKRLFKCLR